MPMLSAGSPASLTYARIREARRSWVEPPNSIRSIGCHDSSPDLESTSSHLRTQSRRSSRHGDLPFFQDPSPRAPYLNANHRMPSARCSICN